LAIGHARPDVVRYLNHHADDDDTGRTSVEAATRRCLSTPSAPWQPATGPGLGRLRRSYGPNVVAKSHSAWLPLARSPLGGFRTPALTPDARPVLAGIRKPSPRRSFRRALPMLRSRRSAARRRPRKAPASPGKAGSRGSSVRQAREEPGYQVAREILEDPHRFRQGARGRMNEGQVEHRQCPAAKNFDEPSVAHQLRLHDRR